ncbi:MAG: FkbM family methyltransferase [Pseudolabrys sp.]
MEESRLESARDQRPAIPGADVVSVESMFGPLLAFDNDLITEQLVAFGAHTRNEIALLRSFISPGDFIYDIGAHIGTFAIPLAMAAGPSGLVVAIEADARHFSLLWHNLETRKLATSRTVIHAAIADEAQRYSVFRRPGNSGASYLVADDQGEVSKVQRLDALHDQLDHRRRVNLLKIDVEGMELSVLKSATNLVTRDHPILYIELAPALLSRHHADIADMEQFLHSHGYRHFFVNAGDRNSSHDNFQLKPIHRLADGGEFFDLLTIHTDDPRLKTALSLANQ